MPKNQNSRNCMESYWFVKSVCNAHHINIYTHAYEHQAVGCTDGAHDHLASGCVVCSISVRRMLEVLPIVQPILVHPVILRSLGTPRLHITDTFENSICVHDIV